MATERPRQIRQVVRYFAAHGINTDLRRGNGYFYFWGDKEADWYSASVAVSRIDHLTYHGWLEAYRSLEADNAKRTS